MRRNIIATAALAAVLLAAPFAVAQDVPAPMEEGADPAAPIQEPAAANVYEKILAEKADSIVSIKYVLKIQMSFQGQSQDRELNSEVRGVLLNADGLVMTANSQFSPHIRNPQIQFKATPADIRVLFGAEEKEYEARIVARDSNLDLAFLQILDLGDREVKPIDLQTEGSIGIGREVVGVSRLPRSYDNTAMIGRLFVLAKVERPRTMWAIAGEFNQIGLPVFDLEGRVAGFVSNQEGSEGVEGGMAAMMGTNTRPFVLPVPTVARAVKMAEERAKELLANAADENAGENGTADGEKPTEEKPADDGEQPKDGEDGGDTDGE